MPFSRRQGAYFNTSGMVFGSSTPLVTPFPSDISGNVAWFDMQDAASFTNTSNLVPSITNKASGVAWTGAPPGGYPTYQSGESGGLSGKPCLVFNGSCGIFGNESAVVDAVNSGHAYTIFWVGAPDSLNRSEAAFAIGNSASANGSRVWGKNTYQIGSWSLTTTADSAVVTTTQSNHRTVPGVQMHCWHASVSRVSHEMNSGTTGATDINDVTHSVGTTTSDRAALGCRPGLTPDQFFLGKLGELIVYNRRLSASEILRVTAYLRSRWTTTQLSHIETQGDSITNGSSGGTPVYQLLSVPGALISNVATGGRKAWQLLSIDIDFEMIQFRSSGRVISWVMLGSNDGTTGDGTPGSYSSVETFLGDMAEVAARLRALQIVTVVGTVWYRNPAVAGVWGNNPDFNGWVDEVNAAILAAGDGGIYGDFVEDSFGDWWTAGGYSLLGADGIHPTDPGSAVLAATAQRGINRAVAARW